MFDMADKKTAPNADVIKYDRLKDVRVQIENTTESHKEERKVLWDMNWGSFALSEPWKAGGCV